MKKIAIAALDAWYAKIAQKQTLILPVESAGQVDFGVWTPESSVRLDVLKTVKSAKGAFFPQVEDMVRFHVQGKNIEIDPADVMAFGDYTNDLPMLRAAGHPVAMENGVQALKDIAEIVAPVNRDGGLGEVLFRYVLEEDV